MVNILDILIYESGDGGEFQLMNDDIATVSSLTNQVYLALFGGNIEQDTTTEIEIGDERDDWWGNEYVEVPFNSTFERTLNNVALNSSGLRQLENAAKDDMRYFSDYADIEVSATIPDVNKLEITISLNQKSAQKFAVKFVWDNLKNELIEDIII